jgi:class 3 adenylate cyclase
MAAMEPRIQYAQTTDGVSIAFWMLGEGMPLVCTPFIPSHAQLMWRYPEVRRLYEGLAEGRKVISYDARGTGLSDRDPAEMSPDSFMTDLEAVVDYLELESFALMGVTHSGMGAIAYAARYPQRVTKLLLANCYARAADYKRSPGVQAAITLVDSDWELYTETVGHYAFGLAGAQQAQQYAAYFRESVTQQVWRVAISQGEDVDVSDLLQQVKSPTLVLHPRHHAISALSAATHLASRIPNAQLTVIEGRTVGFTEDTLQPVLDAVNEFLREGEETTAPAELPEGMAVLLFADIAESTALTEKLGDAAFRAKARELDTSLRSVINESGGTPVEGKVLGDGVLAVFTSARGAIDCALRCAAAGEPLGLQLHLGIHAGDVIREGNNVYGGAVNIAARVASASAAGEILVSDIVRGLARTSAGVAFDDRGEHTLKGIGEPQRLFAVRSHKA